MVINTVKIIHIFFMVLSVKSITEAQLHGYNHTTTSKVCQLVKATCEGE